MGNHWLDVKVSSRSKNWTMQQVDYRERLSQLASDWSCQGSVWGLIWRGVGSMSVVFYVALASTNN